VSTLIVTGAAGLIGSETVRHFYGLGWHVIGIDNDMRATFFGPEASTAWMGERLDRELPDYVHKRVDIRDAGAMSQIVERVAQELKLIIHTAAQPSHDWAARDPITDFSVNASGTLCLLEAVRRHAPAATFIHTSTNKVYGDTPNHLPLVELDQRFELPESHAWYGGVPETMSIDHSTHSLFGVSKTAADLMVQEYGRYFGMRTVVFRGGCLTGPGHSGAELHGFLSYLMRCAATGKPYTVFGYQGKQVRDNIHSADLVSAFEHVAAGGPSGVYNIGGGRESNCSVLEAIDLCQEITGSEMDWEYSEHNRVGDHMWWVGDLSAFRRDYPAWQLRYDVPEILRDIYDSNVERWAPGEGSPRHANG